jgi:hypothetical protein
LKGSRKEFETVLFEQCCEVRYPPTRKGIDPPTSKEAPGSQGSSPGGVGRRGGALKRTIQHFNCNLIVDMDGEKKFFSLTKHLFSPGQTNPLAKDRGKFELLRK